jgi:hypothetical protein
MHLSYTSYTRKNEVHCLDSVYPVGPVRQIGLAFFTGPPGWESIPGLLKRFTNTGSVRQVP